MTTSELKQILNEQKEANRKYALDFATLQNDDVYSTNYKKAKIDELNAAHQASTRSRGQKAAEILRGYKRSMHAGIDLGDPALGNLIAITSLMGKNTPAAVLDNAILHFKGNNDALETIKQLAEKNEIVCPKLDRAIISEKDLDDAIQEADTEFENASALSSYGVILNMLDIAENGGSAETGEEAATVAPMGLF